MAATISLPADARFTCQGCGKCCRGWAVPVDEPTVERLRRHDWGADPFERSAGPDPYRIRLIEGRCFFLDDQNRCRIHTEISYAAKPAVCRAFPLTVFDLGGRQYARLSFWCPTVAANTGKPLEHQQRWLQEIARYSGRRTVPVTIDGLVEVSSRDLDRVHQTLRRILAESEVPLVLRLGAASALVARLEQAAQREGPTLEETLRTAQEHGVARLAPEALQKGHRRAGRRLLALYLLEDREPGRLAALRRAFSVLLFLAGLTTIHSSAVGSAASWRRIRDVEFDTAGERGGLLTRYFLAKLDSRRYLVGEGSLTAGVNQLIAAFGMIELLARLNAAAGGRRECDIDDLRRAAGAADLLVLEHADQGANALSRRLLADALESRTLAGDLRAALGQF